MVVAEGLLVVLVLILIGNIWVMRTAVKLKCSKMPILAVSDFLDRLQCVLSGIFQSYKSVYMAKPFLDGPQFFFFL